MEKDQFYSDGVQDEKDTWSGVGWIFALLLMTVCCVAAAFVLMFSRKRPGYIPAR